MDAWASKGAPDHVWMEDIFPRMASLKRTFADLTRCDTDELAITTNISIALATIASCLDLSGERNRVILSELDFPTDGHVWIAQEKRGAELVWLKSEDGLTIPLEAYDAAIDERTAVVMVNRVLYRSSAIVDAKAICAMARERGALSFVDDYHGIGSCRSTCTTWDATSTPRHAEVAARRAGHGVPLCAARSVADAGAGDHGVVRDAGAVLVRQPAPRLPPDGQASGARHAAGAGVLHRTGRARHHQRGHAGADPRTPGRADRSRHRPRGRGRAPGAHAARPVGRAAAS